MNPTQSIGPWPLGIDNVSLITSLARDDRGRTVALRDAVNVDVTRDGQVSRRSGRALALAHAGAHSLRTTAQGTLFAAAGVLYSFDGTAAMRLADLNSDDPCDYDEIDDSVIVANRTTLLRVRAGVATPLGLPVPGAPVAAPADAGGMTAGRYAVAYAFVRGAEEGPLSPLSIVEIAQGQGVTLDALPTETEAGFVRVYRSPPDGDALYHAVDVPAGMTRWQLGNDTLGRQPSFPFMDRMPPGRFVAAWRGRLMTAHGRTIAFSEPFAYGVFSRRHNIIQAPHRVVMLQPVQGGVYVGTTHGVWFLQGTGPKDAQWLSLSVSAPAEGCYAQIDGGGLPEKMGMSGQELALWLGEHGFVVGTQSGQVEEIQAERLSINAGQKGALTYHARRVFAIVT